LTPQARKGSQGEPLPTQVQAAARTPELIRGRLRKETLGRDVSPLTQLQPPETVAKLVKRCAPIVIPRLVPGDPVRDLAASGQQPEWVARINRAMTYQL